MTDWYSQMTQDAPREKIRGTDWYSDMTGESQTAPAQPVNRIDEGMKAAMEGLPLNPDRALPQPQVSNEYGTNLRQPGYSPSNIIAKAKNVITGDLNREYNIPEFTIPIDESKPLSEQINAYERRKNTETGAAISFDPKRQAAVWKKKYPDLKFGADRYGNIIVDATPYGGDIGYLNSPGLSLRDITQAGYTLAAFTPAGRLAEGAKLGGYLPQTIHRMGRVASGSMATEAGLDLANQAAGGTPDVSLSNIDIGNVGIAGLGAGAFEGIGIALAKGFMGRGKIEVTPQIRKTFKDSAESVGIDPEKLTDDVIMGYLVDAEKATGGQARGGEFGIRFTQGQNAGDPKALSREATLRDPRAGSGKSVQMMSDFDAAQNADIMAARQRMQEGLGGTPIDNPAQAGETSIQGVRTKAQVAQEATDAAYGEVKRASLKAEGQRGLFTRLQRVAKTKQFETEPDLAPATNKAMKEINNYSQWLEENRAPPLALRRIESFRKRINRWIGTAKNQTDKAQVMQIKREYDNYLAKAVDRELFLGDQEALNNLKKARGLHQDYMETFTQQKVKSRTGITVEQDQAGAIIQRMVEGDPNPTEAINFIFGISSLGAKKGTAARLVTKLKSILPEDEFNQLRQAGFIRLTDPGKGKVTSAQKFLSNLTKSMNENPELMNALYSKDELALFNRFALEIQRAQPNPAMYGNVSGSAYKGKEIVGDMWKKLMRMFAFTQGGPLGSIVAEGGIKATEGLQGFRKVMQTRNATNQTRPLARIGIGQYGAAAALGAGND